LVGVLIDKTVSRPTGPAVLERGGVRLDEYRHRAFADGREVELTPTEFRLLRLLLGEPGAVWGREALVAVLSKTNGVAPQSVSRHVMKLRRKLGRPGLIQTVRGVGYRFRTGPSGLPPV
jgi:DNA-binding response OmpR family regulator